MKPTQANPMAQQRFRDKAAAVTLALLSVSLSPETASASPHSAVATEARCALGASSSVRVEGRGMLRLGDVQGCDGVRWEIIQGLFIDGQPAVRLLPSEACGVSGSESVLADGAPVSRQGDGC